MNRIKLLVFRITDKCNLKCSYCYATANSETKVMDFITAKKVLDYIKDNYITDQNMKVQFTGGEPLLEIDLIVKIIEYINKMGIKASFQIQSNGTLINQKIIDIFKKHKISVGISLDGIPEINDIYRVYKNGNGSGRDTIRGISLLGANNIFIGVTATITNKNIRRLDELIDLLSFLGNVKGIGFDLFRPIGRGKDKDLKATKEDILYGVERAIKRNDYLVELGGKSIDIKEIEKIRLAKKMNIKRTIYCYALSGESFAVVAEGDVYPCSSFAGNKNYRLFNIYDKTKDFKKSIKPFIKKNNLINYYECKTCKDKDICGSGCVARGFENQRVDISECMLKKYYIKYVGENYE